MVKFDLEEFVEMIIQMLYSSV